MSELVRISEDMKTKLENHRDDHEHSSIDSALRDWHNAWKTLNKLESTQ